MCITVWYLSQILLSDNSPKKIYMKSRRMASLLNVTQISSSHITCNGITELTTYIKRIQEQQGDFCGHN